MRKVTLYELQNLEARSQAGEGLPYHDPRVTSLVWELKYHASRRAAALAGELLAERLLAIAAEELGAPLLIPVPMHAARLKERGHNQTEVLCRAAIKHIDGALEYEPVALARVRATPFQQGLPKQIRIKNVRNSMLVRYPEKVVGRICIVVDDVQTTGATLNEAKRALKKAGARRVHLLSLAHA